LIKDIFYFLLYYLDINFKFILKMETEQEVLKKDTEIPSFVYYGGIISIISLIISFFLIIGLIALNPQAHDILIHNKSEDQLENGLAYSSVAFLVLGIILGTLIVYGHIIKQKRDPQIVWGTKNMVHLPHIDTTKVIEEEHNVVQLKNSFGNIAVPRRDPTRLNKNAL